MLCELLQTFYSVKCDDKIIMNGEEVRIWKEVVMTHFEVLPCICLEWQTSQISAMVTDNLAKI
jgi:hypothetical protein